MEWIKCSSSKLPRPEREVLVCSCIHGDIDIGDYTKTHGWTINGNVYFEPTHWMEFPMLPNKPNWYQDKKKHELPQFLKLKPNGVADYKYFHVDGTNMFYEFYEGEASLYARVQ